MLQYKHNVESSWIDRDIHKLIDVVKIHFYNHLQPHNRLQGQTYCYSLCYGKTFNSDFFHVLGKLFHKCKYLHHFANDNFKNCASIMMINWLTRITILK